MKIKRKMRVRRAGRDVFGNLTLVANCKCGWTYSTIYRMFRKSDAVNFLFNRFMGHDCRPVS